MTWDVAVAGTVHCDDITTPQGRRVALLGGSAVYFALAAARFAPVRLNGIVGSDRAEEFRALLEPAVDLEGMVVSAQPTFVWHARHDFDRWVAVDTAAEEGCDPLWRPQLPPPSQNAEILFVASMRPRLQLEVLRQSRARTRGADSMTDYTAPERDAVIAVAQGSDVLFLDRNELASLTETAPAAWRDAARALCGTGRLRAVVVKAGPAGAACVTSDGVVERPAVAVARVVDPTGAGDALAGGFLGTLAAAERDGTKDFTRALDAGLVCAADAISDFGVAGLARA